MIDRFRDHAANERTFLAWVRTTIAVVGFGIAGARIGPAANADVLPGSWSDVLVLFAGAVVIGLAYWRMQMLRRRIDSEDSRSDEAMPIDGMLVVLVIAFFALLAAFALRIST